MKIIRWEIDIWKINLLSRQTKEVQVSLAIRGGYVSDKSKTLNTKTVILGLNKANEAKNSSFALLFAVFESVNSQNRKYQNRE